MRLSAVVTMAAIAEGSAWAGETVTVRMAPGLDVQARQVAQHIASEIFAGVGVQLAWLRDCRSCPDADIVVSLSYHTPGDQHPDAMAYALPYEGTHIVVFYDRVQQKVQPARAPILLAYVLVHEITHILQGVMHHSESGIMKAHWDSTDLFEMGRKPLAFADEDVRLIRLGLNWRRTRPRWNPLTGVSEATRNF
jgi:hypothetical protein